MPDLWPQEIGTTHKRASVDILREQATLLSEKTSGIVAATVNYLEVSRFTASQKGGEFRFGFDILAPRLDNYSYTLLTTYNKASLYPVTVEFDGFEGGKATAQSEAEDTDLLRAVFSSKTTLDLIEAIRVQAVYEHSYHWMRNVN